MVDLGFWFCVFIGFIVGNVLGNILWDQLEKKINKDK